MCRKPQKTLEKQNFTLSFAAFSLLLMFNFSFLLSFIYPPLFFFLTALFWCILSPSSLLSAHPSLHSAADSTHPHPHCRTWWLHSCPTVPPGPKGTTSSKLQGETKPTSQSHRIIKVGKDLSDHPPHRIPTAPTHGIITADDLGGLLQVQPSTHRHHSHSSNP